MINNILLSLFIIFFFLSILHESIFFSIFFLICLFIVSSLIFLFLGFEFIGFLYLIVYVGAIAVLFLFMVMLFDKSEYLFFSQTGSVLENNKHKIVFYLAGLGISLAIVLKFYLYFYFGAYISESLFHIYPYTRLGVIDVRLEEVPPIHLDNFINGGTNLQRIGYVIYNYFYIAVFGAALILLIGMVGAIILTQTFFWGERLKKHQDIKKQIVRKRVS